MFYNLFAIFCIIYYFQAFLAFLACLAFSNISSSSIFLGLAASGKDKQSQFCAFFETLKPKCSWVDGTGIFDHLDYRITFILLISCFHIKGRYHYVVNCPTRWSLSFIFVFLCWSSNKYQKYKSVELGDQLIIMVQVLTLTKGRIDKKKKKTLEVKEENYYIILLTFDFTME